MQRMSFFLLPRLMFIVSTIDTSQTAEAKERKKKDEKEMLFLFGENIVFLTKKNKKSIDMVDKSFHPVDHLQLRLHLS